MQAGQAGCCGRKKLNAGRRASGRYTEKSESYPSKLIQDELRYCKRSDDDSALPV